MKKKLFLMVMLAVALVCGMAVISCINAPSDGNEGGSIPSELVGIWRPSDEASSYVFSLEFRSNGDFLQRGQIGFTFSVSGHTVTVKMKVVGGEIPYARFDYSISSGQMTITNVTSDLASLEYLSPWNKE
jgi:hypothetical protein